MHKRILLCTIMWLLVVTGWEVTEKVYQGNTPVVYTWHGIGK